MLSFPHCLQNITLHPLLLNLPTVYNHLGKKKIFLLQSYQRLPIFNTSCKINTHATAIPPPPVAGFGDTAILRTRTCVG